MILTFKNYKITTDDRQFIVQEKRKVQEGRFTKEENIGKDYWANIGYFGSLKYALKSLAKLTLLRNNDIDTIVSELKALEGKIDELIKVTKEEK